MKNTLLFLLHLIIVFYSMAADKDFISKRNLLLAWNQIPDTSIPIRLHCMASVISSEPLIIVDGELSDSHQLDFLNANDIEKITILKYGDAIALYGSKAVNGVIIINTRNICKLKIQDGQDGRPLEYATVKIYTSKDHRDSLVKIADKTGEISLAAATKNSFCEAVVSCSGYQTEMIPVFFDKLQKKAYIKLQRIFQKMPEVFITGYNSITCKTRCCFRVMRSQKGGNLVQENNNQNLMLELFPNPVRSQSTISIRLTKPVNGRLQLINSCGQIVEEAIVQKEIGQQIPFSVPGVVAGLYYLQFLESRTAKPLRYKIVIQ